MHEIKRLLQVRSMLRKIPAIAHCYDKLSMVALYHTNITPWDKFRQFVGIGNGFQYLNEHLKQYHNIEINYGDYFKEHEDLANFIFANSDEVAMQYVCKTKPSRWSNQPLFTTNF